MGEMSNEFVKVGAGHYRHAETGIEIVKIPAHRDGGYAVGVRWEVRVPTLRIAGYRVAASTRSRAVAAGWACKGEGSTVEWMRAHIAGAYDQAYDQAHAEDDELGSFMQYRAWVARHDLLSGRREHVNRAIEADHDEAIAENATRERVPGMPMKFRKRPVVVEAVRWTGDNYADVVLFAEGQFAEIAETGAATGVTAEVFDYLHSASIPLRTGDWIIRGIRGEYYPCKADVFEATYEPWDR